MFSMQHYTHFKCITELSIAASDKRKRKSNDLDEWYLLDRVVHVCATDSKTWKVQQWPIIPCRKMIMNIFHRK